MKEKPKDNSIRFHYCNEHDRLCIACPDCVESARKEGYDKRNPEIKLLKDAIKYLEEKRESARKEGYERGKQDEKNAWRIVGNWSKELESARKESFENGRILGFEAGLVDDLVEKRVEKARKEGAEQDRKNISSDLLNKNGIFSKHLESRLIEAEQRGADAKEKEIYEIILHISEGCPEEDCECQIIAEMLIPLMVRHEQRGAEARDAKLLEIIRSMPSAQSDDSMVRTLDFKSMQELLSPKPEETKKGD